MHTFSSIFLDSGLDLGKRVSEVERDIFLVFGVYTGCYKRQITMKPTIFEKNASGHAEKFLNIFFSLLPQR